MKIHRFLFSLLVIAWTASAAQDTKMKFITGGSFLPLYGVEDEEVVVSSFMMDVYPVTNEEFSQFLKENPEWQKEQVKGIFANKNYLPSWEGSSYTGNPKAPVTGVSWFAAKKYCECKGKRLPTVDEWEYAAMADEEVADARKKESYNQYILSWYEASKATQLNPVGRNPANYWGIHDMHGLIWEWTQDFNSVMMAGESRKDTDRDARLFCGSAAIGASDLMNYAAFMRYAYRGSLKARYAVKNLGFRCVKDTDKSI